MSHGIICNEPFLHWLNVMHFPLILSKMGRRYGQAQPSTHIAGHPGSGISQVARQLGLPLHLVHTCSPGHVSKNQMKRSWAHLKYIINWWSHSYYLRIGGWIDACNIWLGILRVSEDQYGCNIILMYTWCCM